MIPVSNVDRVVGHLEGSVVVPKLVGGPHLGPFVVRPIEAEGDAEKGLLVQASERWVGDPPSDAVSGDGQPPWNVELVDSIALEVRRNSHRDDEADADRNVRGRRRLRITAAVDVVAGDVNVLEVPDVVVDVPALLAVGHDAAEIDD